MSWLKSFWEAVGTSGNLQGTLMVVSGLAIILLALAFITKNMRSLVADRVERSVNAMLSKGGGAAALVLGLVITIAVQSSSITTSILIPLAGAGVITLRNAYPVTLGANVGTTITALLASLATGAPEALTVALAHTTFNVFGIFLLYVIPLARYWPIFAAERLADVAVKRRTTAVAYVAVVFVVFTASWRRTPGLTLARKAIFCGSLILQRKLRRRRLRAHSDPGGHHARRRAPLV